MGKYDPAQREAEHAGRGMWAGSYVEPWLYRACVRANGARRIVRITQTRIHKHRSQNAVAALNNPAYSLKGRTNEALPRVAGVEFPTAITCISDAVH